MPDQMMLNSAAADALQDLLEVIRDSEQGYRRSAEEITDRDLRSAFTDLADKRADQAQELEQLITKSGGTIAGRGPSLSGTAHRLFVSLRAAISRNDRLAIISEIARGESYAEGQIDRLLRIDLAPDIKDTIQRLHRSVRESRDAFRRQRDAERGSNGDGYARLADTVTRSGQRSIETVSSFVSDRPLVSALVALGIGFVIGAAVTGRSSSSQGYLRD